MREMEVIRFGRFDYLPELLTLLHDGARVPIGSRATAILHRLLRNPGANVPASELVLSAWPDTFVEDCNLRAQIAVLRRAIDAPDVPSHIRNAPGRGYAFVVPVEWVRLTVKGQAVAGEHA